MRLSPPLTKMEIGWCNIMHMRLTCIIHYGGGVNRGQKQIRKLLGDSVSSSSIVVLRISIKQTAFHTQFVLHQRMYNNKLVWSRSGRTKLSDIKDGTQKWKRLMIARKRKTLVLCVECHDLLHAGKLPDWRFKNEGGPVPDGAIPLPGNHILRR